MSQIKTWLTDYGFSCGPVSVERGFSDDNKGWVTLLLQTKKHPNYMQIYVTKTGKVRIYSVDGEWKPSATEKIRKVKK
jgi:hypothetical protein